MLRDPMLLVNIQLAIMGIVLVAGLFYLWRMICRLEKRVDDFMSNEYMNRIVSPSPKYVMQNAGTSADATSAVEIDAEIEEDDDDEFMNKVFGGDSATIVIGTSQPSFSNKPTVEIEEEDAATTVSTSNITKSKLKRMSVDGLREICKERGLPTDGTKVALQDRILETIDDMDAS